MNDWIMIKFEKSNFELIAQESKISVKLN